MVNGPLRISYTVEFNDKSAIKLRNCLSAVIDQVLASGGRHIFNPSAMMPSQIE